LNCIEGREDGGYGRQTAQFENAIGGVDWYKFFKLDTNTNIKPRIPCGSDKQYLCCGWYSPTYYSPNYFNFANNKRSDYCMNFSIGRNWLNRNDMGEYNEIPPIVRNHPLRYPQDWTGLDDNGEPKNKKNLGYVGFWTEPGIPPDSNAKRYIKKYEYIQQKLKQPLSPLNTYQISFIMSKNNRAQTGGQRIGAYFSQEAPLYEQDDNNYMIFDYPLTDNKEGTLVLAPNYHLDYNGGDYGTDNWVPVVQQFRVPIVCDYITIGLFKAGRVNTSDDLYQTAYYIDNVHIENLTKDSCSCVYYAPEPDPLAEIRIIPSENNQCCYSFYFHKRLDFPCSVMSVRCSVTIGTANVKIANFIQAPPYQKSDFTFGDLCITDADLASANDSLAGNPTVTFRFQYTYATGKSCFITDTLKLNCTKTCSCDYLSPRPNPLDIIKDSTKTCCYDIKLNLNNENELDRYCKFYKAVVFESHPVYLDTLFTDYASKENGIVEANGNCYYYPGNAIIISNDRKLCFEPTLIPVTKTIMVRLWKHNPGLADSYCEYSKPVNIVCPISCSDLSNLTTSLNINLIPKEKVSGSGKCCFEVHLINNTGLNVIFSELLLNFSSTNITNNDILRVKNFEDQDFAPDILTIPIGWDYSKNTDDQTFSFKKELNDNYILNNGLNLHIADICIPESDESINIEFKLRDPFSYDNNYCTISHELISCPSSDSCNCKESSLLDFTMDAIQRDSVNEECCYAITLNPPNINLSCAITEVKAYIKDQGNEEYAPIPNISELLEDPLTQKITLTGTYCPPLQNSSISVKVVFMNENHEIICSIEKNINLNPCPCSCGLDMPGTLFNLYETYPGSCCYLINIHSDCPKIFSSFCFEFPTISDYIDESNFEANNGQHLFIKDPHNKFVFKPNFPYYSDGNGGILGYFCLPQLPDSLTRPITIKLSALSVNGDTCTQNSFSANCQCCNNAVITVTNIGGCTWNITVNNQSPCMLSAVAPKVYITDITRGITGSILKTDNGVSSSMIIHLLPNFSKTIMIKWTVQSNSDGSTNADTVCTKIITLSCSGAGVGTVSLDNSTGPNPKEVIPFTNINNGVIEKFEFAPNPASDEANIRYDLLQDVKKLSLTIYNLKGEIVATIPVNNFNKGQNYINLNTSAIISGSYYLVLNADNAKMCLPIRIMR